MEVIITSVDPLSKSQLATLTKGLEKAYPSHKLEIKQEVDPKLLGGLKVKVGSQSFDASLAAKLNSLREKITKEI